MKKKLRHFIERLAFAHAVRARILPFLYPGWQGPRGVEPAEDLPSYERCYQIFGIVMAGVSAYAQAGAMVPMIWYKVPAGKTEKEKQPLDYQHPLCKLFRTLNPFDTKYDIDEEIWSFLPLTGNYYLCQEPTNVKQPTQLWGMRPSRVRIRVEKTVDEKRFISGYTFANDFGEVVELPASDVLHLKLFNPTNPFYGQGFITAIREELMFDLDMLKYNRRLVKNMGVPYGGWETDMLLEANEVERVKKELHEQFTGVNTGKESFTHGGLKWRDHGMSPRDMQWPQARKDVRGRALQGMQIPPVLAGMAEDVNTFATALIQERIFWRITIIPKQTKMAARFTQWAQPRWGEDILAAYDYSNVEALREDEERKAKIFQIGFQCGAVRPDDMRQSVYKLEAIGGDAGKLWAPIGMIPVEGTEAKIPRIAVDGTTRKRRYIESEERTAKWNKWVTALLPWEKKWKAGWIHSIDALEARLKTIPLRSHRQDEWEIIDAGIDEELELSELRALCHKLATEIVDGQGQVAMAALGIGSDFNVSNPNVAAWITKKAMTFSTNVWGTTKATLEAAVKAAVSDPSLTVTEVAKAIEQAIGTAMDVRRSDAMRVARTESVSAANAGNQLAWEQSGVVEGREWLTARDELVRESHAAMDGETALMNEPYSNDLMFPGDPSGEPGEIINCRCTELAQVSEEKMLAVLATRIEKAVYPGREGSKKCELKEKLLSVR
jgi:HK97 family phage portal protein